MFRVELPVYPRRETNKGVIGQHALSGEIYQANSAYWHEGFGYEITQAQADVLRDATEEVHRLMCGAMDYITDCPAVLKKFRFCKDESVNGAMRRMAVQSWRDLSQRSYVLSRLDMAWNGVGAPKLLEINQGGYLGLVESTSVLQDDYFNWLRQQSGYSDIRPAGNMASAFASSLDEVVADRRVDISRPMALLIEDPHEQSDSGMLATGKLLEHWMRAARLNVIPMEIRDVDCGLCGMMVDTNSNHMLPVADSCPWVYPFLGFESYAMAHAERQARGDVVTPGCRSLTSMWEMVAGNKAMLPVMYQLFPEHPNLLPAVFGNTPLSGQKSVQKHMTGRQAFGSIIRDERGKVACECQAPYFSSFYRPTPANVITQAYADGVDNPDGSVKVIHVFLANGRFAGAGVREAPCDFVGGSKTNTMFVPLAVRDQPSTAQDAPAYKTQVGIDGEICFRIRRMPGWSIKI
jgi:glutathionylspermidine synthase